MQRLELIENERVAFLLGYLVKAIVMASQQQQKPKTKTAKAGVQQ